MEGLTMIEVINMHFSIQIAVIQATDKDKYSISVEWTAPAVLGTGQVVIQ